MKETRDVQQHYTESSVFVWRAGQDPVVINPFVQIIAVSPKAKDSVSM